MAVQSVDQTLGGPGKVFPRLATLAERAQIVEILAEERDDLHRSAREKMRQGHPVAAAMAHLGGLVASISILSVRGAEEVAITKDPKKGINVCPITRPADPLQSRMF